MESGFGVPDITLHHIVDSTGTSATEAGFLVDTQEIHDTGIFARLLKHIMSRPKSINMVQYDPYNPNLTI